MEIAKPIIEHIPNTENEIKNFKEILNNFRSEIEKDLIYNYPTVYIHNWENKDKYEVYVGESNDFFQRTDQHHELINESNSWQHNLMDKSASLYVIAHTNFNKSMTLDVENRLIHYLSSCNSVTKVHNARGNPQNKYFPCEELDSIFSKIWKQLRAHNKSLFLSESEIKDSAIYKASPLHKLNSEQLAAKEKILDNIDLCLIKNRDHQLVFVQGDAGTGKTVLMSSMFYDLLNRREYTANLDGVKSKDLEIAIIVNHKEQLIVYEEIVKKLDLGKNNEQLVFNPTQFINLFKNKKNSPKKRDKIYDVVFVDEAHLLLTQKNQAYIEENDQLSEILKYSKVVVVMFDRKQIMNAEQYLDNDTINQYINISKSNDSHIKLSNQMRMNANKDILKWLQLFCEEARIDKLSSNRGKYEIKAFDSPEELECEIKNKAANKESSLSRIVATYDWPYSGKSAPKDEKYWNVKIGNWIKPWNRELMRHANKSQLNKIKGLSWAEQEQTIDEVGSTYTIQGFDLNYAGVILGPSIKYRDGKVIFDTAASFNNKAKRRRTLTNGLKESFGEEFLRNELGVLLTRGVNGLYIYACDDELRKKLKQCI